MLEIEMPHWPQAAWKELPGEPLERMFRLLEGLENPHLKLPPVVHVAGTNGKGSTIAFMRAMLEAAGYKVHAYTSPHIQKFSERIVVASEPVDEKELYLALETCRMVNEEQPIGFFEGTTAAAFWLFSQTPADIVLLETGIGGQDDPTNVLEKVRLSVVTTISEDHQEYLGDTLAQITSHKAGIIKNECPVVIGFQPPDVMELLEKSCDNHQAPAAVYGKHWAVQKAVDGFVYADGHGQVNLPEPALKGPHQLINAGCAIAALSLLDEFDIMGDHIAAGLRWVQWQGRLEQFTPESLPKGSELWFDGGHNMAAGHMLAVMAQEEWQDKPLYIIFGTTRGKDIVAMLQPLAQLSQEIIAVPVTVEPKCYTPQEMMDMGDDVGLALMQANSTADAYEQIMQMAEGEDVRILIFGSLYLRLEAEKLS